MKLTLSHRPINTTCKTFRSSTSVCRLSISKSIYHASAVQNNSISSGFAAVSKGEGSYKLLCARNSPGEMLLLMRCNARKRIADMSKEQVMTEVSREESYSNSDKGIDRKVRIELERRRNIGLAKEGKVPWNKGKKLPPETREKIRQSVKEAKKGKVPWNKGKKGKVPWNKGKKHPPETREKISQRIKEALSDPKVRQKFFERTHSNETKKKIAMSRIKQWGKRSKFYQSWAESIANAAKVGGSDQEELEWDSYEKIKREIALKRLQHFADKAKAKEIRAERAAQKKTEKRERLAQRRKEGEDRGQDEGKRKIPKRRSKQEKQELAVAEELKYSIWLGCGKNCPDNIFF